MEKIRFFFVKNKYVWILFGLLLGSGILLFHKFLFGKAVFAYNDVGADTLNLYLPIYTEIVNKLEAFDFSFWSFHYGLGNNMLDFQSLLLDPFSYLVFAAGLIFGIESIGKAIAVVYLFKIITVGLLCYVLLGYYVQSEKVKIICSYIMAFNAFIMLWGQHPFFVSASAMILLSLIFCEKYFLQGHKIYMLALVVALSVLLNFYISYMVTIAVSLYILFRYLYLNECLSFKKVIKDIFNYLGLLLLGYGIAATFLLPNINILLNVSGRLSDMGTTSVFQTMGQTLFALFDKSYYICFFGRLLGNNFIGDAFSNNLASNYYETIQNSCSVLVLFAAPQMLWRFVPRSKDALTRKRVIPFIAFLSGLYLLLIAFGGYMFNAFAYAITRYTFLLMPLLAILLAVFLEQIFLKRKISIWVLNLTALGIIIAIIKVVTRCQVELDRFYVGVVFLALGIIYTILLINQVTKEHISQNIIIILFVIAAIQIQSDNYITLNHRGIISEDTDKGNFDLLEATQKTIEYLEEQNGKSFYRVAKDYYGFFVNDPLMSDMRGLSEYNSIGNKYLWDFIENVSAQSIIWHNMIFDFSRDGNLYAFLGVKYVLSINEIQDERLQFLTTVDGINIYENLEYKGNVFLCQTIVDEEFFRQKSEAEKKEILQNAVVLSEENKLEIEKEAEIAGYELVMENSGHLKTQIYCKDASILRTTIPFETGWNIYIDGEKKEALLVDLAFVGVSLEPGEHEIELKYRTPYLNIGICLSVISIIIFVGLAIWNKQKERKI